MTAFSYKNISIFIFHLLTSILLLASCFSGGNKIIIEGTVVQDNNTKIYLSLIIAEESVLIDSASIKNCIYKFDFIPKSNNISQPDFYKISISPENYIVTIAKKGDKIKINTKSKILCKNHSVSGSQDAILMWKLDQMLNCYTDSINILYKDYELNQYNDSIKNIIENQYEKAKNRYTCNLISFIEDNISSFASIIAFYQTYNRCRFINEAENLSLLMKLTNNLSYEYPNNENIKYLEKRVEYLKRFFN